MNTSYHHKFKSSYSIPLANIEIEWWLVTLDNLITFLLHRNINNTILLWVSFFSRNVISLTEGFWIEKWLVSKLITLPTELAVFSVRLWNNSSLCDRFSFQILALSTARGAHKAEQLATLSIWPMAIPKSQLTSGLINYRSGTDAGVVCLGQNKSQRRDVSQPGFNSE